MSAPTSTALDEDIRKLVLDTFLERGIPPLAEQIAQRFNISLAVSEETLDRLDAAHHLKLVPGTHRILMAFPFSAIATPYRVVLTNGREYFANCAWDAVAFHVMLNAPIRVESYCHHCTRAVQFDLKEYGPSSSSHDLPVIYLGLPAADWWKDIVRTCGSTMLLFGSTAHLEEWRREHPEESGQEVSLVTMVKLSEPLYRTKMERGFVRPSRDELVALFDSLDLRGPFWQV